MKTPGKKLYSFIFLAASCMLLFSSCENNERALVVGKIQAASDLVSTEFTVDKVVFGTKTRNLMWFKFSEAQFMAYSQAKIKAGIDLNKIQEEDIVISEGKIQLRLPPIEVLNFSYPPSGFIEDSLISDPKVFLNNINIRDQEEFFRLAELDIRENLQYMGLVNTTQSHTRQMFKVLLGSLGYKEIYITFKNNELLIPQVNISGQEQTQGEN